MARGQHGIVERLRVPLAQPARAPVRLVAHEQVDRRLRAAEQLERLSDAARRVVRRKENRAALARARAHKLGNLVRLGRARQQL